MLVNKISDVLRSEEITVIWNIDKITMKKLERWAQTLIFPSALLLESTTSLGSWDTFYIQRFNAKSNFVDKSTYLHNDRTLIYFKGTPSHLGCTILLFGDTLKNLEKVKTCLKMMIRKTRDVILESIFLTQINWNVPIIKNSDEQNQMFLSHQNIYIDEPKFICRMHIMRIGKDVEKLKEVVRNEQKDPEERFIKRNLNEMWVLPRK